MAESSPVLEGRYELHDRIGGGGMGEVWRATDRLLGRTVAVKVILQALVDEPTFLRRFYAEAKAMAKVHHPGVVTIHDFKGDAGGAYLVMEYVEGEPLSRLLHRAGRLSPSAVMSVVRQSGAALQLVHTQGIVHRDIKPSNMLIRPDGQVVLADFGVAMGTGITNSDLLLGTPSYISPEQVTGAPASARSDIYSLGVVAYQCLAGRLPFVADNPIATATMRIRHTPPPLPGDVPPRVAAVVERAMALDPGERWSSAGDFAGAAQRAMPGPKFEDPTVVLIRDTPLRAKPPADPTVPAPRRQAPARAAVGRSAVPLGRTGTGAHPAVPTSVGPDGPGDAAGTTIADPAWLRRRRRRTLTALLIAAVLAGAAYLAWRQSWLPAGLTTWPPRW
jgi:serine/threonine-protein kinase